MTIPGGRKFVVVMTALLSGTLIAFTRQADVLAAYATLAAICVAAFMGAHGVQDYKNGKAP